MCCCQCHQLLPWTAKANVGPQSWPYLSSEQPLLSNFSSIFLQTLLAVLHISSSPHHCVVQFLKFFSCLSTLTCQVMAPTFLVLIITYCWLHCPDFPFYFRLRYSPAYCLCHLDSQNSCSSHHNLLFQSPLPWWQLHLYSCTDQNSWKFSYTSFPPIHLIQSISKSHLIYFSNIRTQPCGHSPRPSLLSQAITSLPWIIAKVCTYASGSSLAL